ncbi:MAG: RNA polymerase sigma factor [Oscillospiraceae bacterium]|nr:RNA polymerase sigma factor [Oscillospiraceae bacterium]
MIKTLSSEDIESEDIDSMATAIQPRLSETQIVDDYGGSVYRFCRSLTYTVDDAEDLYQDTFLNAFTQMKKVERAKNPQGFLLSTAAFLWKSQRRKYARRNRLAPETGIDAYTNIGIAGGNVEDGLLTSEERDVVRSLVDDLPEKLKLPIVLYYTNEMRIAEIASILKLPAGTVMSRLYKACKLIEKGLILKYGY